ncbi:MAG: 50S ribosomal protein L17 [Candidatus Omnitrophota bacterium]|nr:MAG: 50S ribosomal protein L17 [Candidatus Omnitrophota bacterium]
MREKKWKWSDAARRHRKKSEKFSRPRAQRKALVKALLRSLILYERIKTTQSKAKALRGPAEKLITWAKEDNLHHRRLSYCFLEDHKLVRRLFESIGPRFRSINGGYTRVINLGRRKGDGAKLSILEFTKMERKLRKKREKKEKEKVPREEKREEKPIPKKEKPKKGFITGVRKIFKKERDAL